MFRKLRAADTYSCALDSFPYFQFIIFLQFFISLMIKIYTVKITDCTWKNRIVLSKKTWHWSQSPRRPTSEQEAAFSAQFFRAGQQHCALKCGIQRIFNWYRYTEVTREAVRRPVNHRCHLFRVPQRRYPPRQKWPPAAFALTAVPVAFIFHTLIVKGSLPIFSLFWTENYNLGFVTKVMQSWIQLMEYKFKIILIFV